MRRGRRLALAPATKRALWSGLISSKAHEVDPVSSEAKCAKGRLELSRIVQMVVASSDRPKPVHGPEFGFGRFWAVGKDSDELSEADGSSDSDEVISTTAFIAEAAAAGFEAQDLYKAEQELAIVGSGSNSGKYPKSQLASRIIDSMVRRKLYPEAWQGPLPPPRISPPRTLGDVLEKAREVGHREGKMGGWRASGSAVWATPFSNTKQKDRADKAKDLQLLTPDFPELKSPRVVYCEFQRARFRPGSIY
jgi:hypothetical protein